MSGLLQHRRLIQAGRLAITPANGELIWDLSTSSVFVGDGVTVGGIYIGGAASDGSWYAYSQPASGSTITTVLGERKRVVDPTANIATLTITLPPTPSDGDEWRMIMGIHSITTLTVNAPGGATVNGSAVGAVAGNTGLGWKYRSAITTWFMGA
jgi:hypothetical protein